MKQNLDKIKLINVSNFYDKLLHQYKDIDTDEKAKVIRERIPDSTSSLFDF